MFPIIKSDNNGQGQTLPLEEIKINLFPAPHANLKLFSVEFIKEGTF